MEAESKGDDGSASRSSFLRCSVSFSHAPYLTMRVLRLSS
jgi:hypothetical protein